MLILKFNFMKNKFLKVPLKSTLFVTTILAFSTISFSSCGNEEEGRITVNDAAPAKITNVNTVAGPGEVYLSWTNPESPSFMYTKIEYINSKGENKYHLLSKERIGPDGIARDTIRGFADTQVKKISLYACSVRGNNQGAVEVSISPESPVFTKVAKTITLSTDLGGINVHWKNSYSSAIYIVLNYHAANDATKSGYTKFKVNGKTESSQFVQLTYGSDNKLLSGEECIVNVTAEDEEENASAATEFSITPIAVVKISKKNWSFPGYSDNSNNATIGYSSQESQGEGASPNGRVIALLDNNLNTFWHASWKVASDYPHWFIIDMGENITISSIELTRRQGNEKGQKGQHFYTCSDENAINKANPDSWTWIDRGGYTFDITTDSPQIYRLTSNPIARYIKVYFGTEYKGNGSYAMLSEIDVYGAK